MRYKDLPVLVRFVIRHFVNGAALGCAALLAAIYFDVASLGSLLEKDKSGLATALLFIQVALLIGVINMAVAVMALGEDKG